MLALTSCHSENEKSIQGKWQGIEWLANGKPSDMKATATAFEFDDKGNYSFDYAGEMQTGTYKVENNMLFTTPVGEQEIMVKITKLKGDTLVFDMNRGGRPEILTLIKK